MATGTGNTRKEGGRVEGANNVTFDIRHVDRDRATRIPEFEIDRFNRPSRRWRYLFAGDCFIDDGGAGGIGEVTIYLAQSSDAIICDERISGSLRCSDNESAIFRAGRRQYYGGGEGVCRHGSLGDGDRQQTTQGQ